MQEPFFFGSEGREIFGVYHPALGAGSGTLTVICPPLYSEFSRAYSALRNVALALVRRGQHVLRMEYSGTGESYGDLDDATLSGWIKDISLAVDEGRDLSGCRRVQLLGVRGSALLACSAAIERLDIDRVVLWDPAIDGAEYKDSLLREQEDALREHLYLNGAERREFRKGYDLYRMPASMWDEWSTLEASTYLNMQPEKLRVVCTPKANEFEVDSVQKTYVDFRVDWETKNGEVFMCQPVLEALLHDLTAP